jgi:hypothetical protein
VSSETPGTHLARLKDTYRGYVITHAVLRPGYVAHRRTGQGAWDSLYAPDLPGLEAALARVSRN